MTLQRLSRVVLVVLALQVACGKAQAPTAEQATPVTIPAAPAVTDEGGPYALRYFSAASGELVTVRKPAEVPEGARGQVLVAYEDPKLQGPWLYVADLTQKSGQGYPVASVDRLELEKQAAAARPAAAAPAPGAREQESPVAAAPSAGQGDVVIYRTAWCGYCKKAAEYLKLKGVPFVEKDLERDPGARQDMLARARAAGVPPESLQGVPILSVKGRMISGFNRQAIDAALAGQ